MPNNSTGQFSEKIPPGQFRNHLAACKIQALPVLREAAEALARGEIRAVSFRFKGEPS